MSDIATSSVSELVARIRDAPIATAVRVERAVADLGPEPIVYMDVVLHCANIMLENPNRTRSSTGLYQWVLARLPHHPDRYLKRLQVLVTALHDLRVSQQSTRGLEELVLQIVDAAYRQHRHELAAGSPNRLALSRSQVYLLEAKGLDGYGC